STGEERTELQMRLIEALAERAEAVDAERPMVVEALQRLTADEEYLVRRHAAAALRRLGLPAPPIGAASDSRTLATYRDIVQRTARERWARIETARGAIDLRLACPDAPLTCLSFLQLAEQRFYDGLPFHRVVPDFVVQAGDPSGGGWGGPGYTLRDEINRLRFDSGVVGMAHAGPDTAGSQFFVTLSPQPHLDGAYTAFGRVERGFEHLRALQQEDVILTIREIPPPAGSGREVG
ncbi:MAG: peptidylprolyl isomerase, partial [Thermoanaerobaculia bacterium]|nr:peptidylprolyl isomerase [Thermoanaerobaculia bacterium]